MTSSEVEQIELLSRVDNLVERLQQWSEFSTDWEPMQLSRAMIRRLLDRVKTLRIRLEAPLVVATFGGTGTGKSSLVNALVGTDCTATGKQRPTTTKPVLIADPDLKIEMLGLPLDELEVKRIRSPVLQNVVFLDCPDPDTTEREMAGTNLSRLHRLLPHCDVLIYTSTQQKYRSAKVGDELGTAAEGCRLLFVQTHAELDEDIREDWKRILHKHYEVPEMFFVDSVRAFDQQTSGKQPDGDFRRLVEVLNAQLNSTQRFVIRRANMIDLIALTLQRNRQEFEKYLPQVERLLEAIENQNAILMESLTEKLNEELKESHNLWERRLIQNVTLRWGVSPFSLLLRAYHGLGNLFASFSFFRARTSAQMALIGAMQGARWLKRSQSEKDSEKRLQNFNVFQISDDQIRESQIVISGYAREAGIDPQLCHRETLKRRQEKTADVESMFLENISEKIESLIGKHSQQNSGWLSRICYEILFIAYPLAFLAWIAKNFFFDVVSLNQPEKLIPLDVYLPAALFFLLWTGLLMIVFTRKLRRGLDRRIHNFCEEIANQKLARGLYPELEEVSRKIDSQHRELLSLIEKTDEMRENIAVSPSLGAAILESSSAVAPGKYSERETVRG